MDAPRRHPQEDGRWTYDLVLLPGSHPYQWVVDGEWQLDAHNPITMSNGMGGRNSALVVDAPVAPTLSAKARIPRCSCRPMALPLCL